MMGKLVGLRLEFAKADYLVAGQDCGSIWMQAQLTRDELIQTFFQRKIRGAGQWIIQQLSGIAIRANQP